MSSYLPVEVIQRLMVKYKPSSIDTIARGIKRIMGGVAGEGAPFDRRVLENYTTVASYISGLEKSSVKPALVGNVLAVAGVLEGFPGEILEQYKQLFGGAAKTHRNEYQYRAVKTEHAIPNLEMIRAWSEKLLDEARAESNRKKWLDGVLLSLYSYMPALRGQEFYATRVLAVPAGGNGIGDLTALAEKLGENFLDLTSWQFVISDYKTQKRYEVRVLRVPTGLRKVLKEWLQLYPSTYLLSDTGGKPLEHSVLTKHLHRLLGEEVSVDMLRKIYIAEMLHYLGRIGLTGKDLVDLRKTIAFHMGHSLEAQEFVYSGLRLDGQFQYSSDEFMQRMLDYYLIEA